MIKNNNGKKSGWDWYRIFPVLIPEKKRLNITISYCKVKSFFFFPGISTEKFDISPIRTFYRYYFLSFFILYLFAFTVFSVARFSPAGEH